MKNIILALIFLLLPLAAHAAEKDKSVLDRVTRTGTIRCGYAIWAPAIMKDPNTGAISGVVHDLMEEAGRRLSLKIEWAEEAGWGSIVEGLVAGRYDVICTGLYASSARSKVVDFGQPLFYAPVYLVARADDARFDAGQGALDDPQYKIVILDGEMSSILARQAFPKAAIHSMPQTSDFSQLLKEVEAGKGDVTLVDMEAFGDYNAANPGRLKVVDRSRPLNAFPTGLGLPQNDFALKRMLDVTMQEMLNDGTVGRLLDKYEKYPGSLLRVAPGYGAAQ